MSTLLTGATGFIGSAVARALLNAGHELRVLTRPGSDTRNIDSLPPEQLARVERFAGDMLDEDSLRRAPRGCDTVVHVAADYRLWVPDPERMQRINVDGTRTLFRAAMDAGVRRVVFTSSVATLKLTTSPVPVDETALARLEDMPGHYKRTKFLAEQEVLRMVRQEGLPAVLVSPTLPVGPRDIKPTPTGRIIRDAMRGQLPAYVDTGLNVAHVDDVAQGHLLALERGTVGESYILGGEDMTLRSILVKVAAMSGRTPPRIRLPIAAVLPVAYVSEFWARLTGREPLATVDGVKMARKFMYFSSAKAKAALGYAPRPADAALADAVAWFRGQEPQGQEGRP